MWLGEPHYGEKDSMSETVFIQSRSGRILVVAAALIAAAALTASMHPSVGTGSNGPRIGSFDPAQHPAGFPHVKAA